jgi:hypothetical protein
MKYPRLSVALNRACKLSIKDRNDIIDKCKKGITKVDLARQYNVNASTIYYWVDPKSRLSQLEKTRKQKKIKWQNDLAYRERNRISKHNWYLYARKVNPELNKYRNEILKKFYHNNLDKVREYTRLKSLSFTPEQKIRRSEWQRVYNIINKDHKKKYNKHYYETHRVKKSV